ncbi:hypothetical protein CVM52_21530 [Pseudooceanicola lipolyticus]|uniref:Uncharacterized protein n=1 Tax=Pseudooceanicola lipolyticus TaxID=2029104 RepID=A0A2M8IVN4_9RHOB|nr:hypothetical protein [Pseudooceanicola lipolyticus]PJE34579.1 hypothetical protein CVM52_21530 [Pseudooceanicola lipolyticus]
MRGLLAGLWLIWAAAPLAAQSWHEPPRGSATRGALMEAVRPLVEWQLGAPVEFIVYDLRQYGDIAFANLYPQRPGGGEIDLYRTPGYARGELSPDFMDGAGVQALYRRSGNTWVAVRWVLGATDVWWSERELCFYWRPVIPDVCQGL